MVGQTTEREGGEVLNPAPIHLALHKDSPCSGSLQYINLGRLGPSSLPVPPNPISCPVPCSLHAFSPRPPLALSPTLGQYYVFTWRQLQSKEHSPAPGLQAGSATTGPGLELQPPQAAPHFGIQKHSQVMGWRKDTDGQEAAEGSMASASVCPSQVFPTTHFPPALLGMSDNSSCES